VAGRKSSKSVVLRSALHYGRITKYLPFARGLGQLCKVYRWALPGGPLELRVDDFDGDLMLDVDPRETIGFNVWHRPEYFERRERKLFCGAIVPGCTVLDVGANVGIYTLLAAKRGAKVFAIEADPQNVEALRRHVSLNGLDSNVTIFHMAATNTAGSVTIFRDRGNSGHSNMFDGSDPVSVQGDTIDSLGLPPIDVCKMDIEGAELMALLGMGETIMRSPRIKMLIEFAAGQGHTNGLVEFVCSRFSSVSAIPRPPSRPREHITASQRLPSFCNLWAVNE
jgi:FkbM family methyltransferase